MDPNDIEQLLDAIARIESHCDPSAVGDGGRALGVYQIHRVYWEEDGTEFLGVDWPHRDAIDPRKARRIVKAYLLHYGKGKSLLDMARIHNGGPHGHKKEATLCYARKILADRSRPSGVHVGRLQTSSSAEARLCVGLAPSGSRLGDCWGKGAYEPGVLHLLSAPVSGQPVRAPHSGEENRHSRRNAQHLE